jgi:hypothetical protein
MKDSYIKGRLLVDPSNFAGISLLLHWYITMLITEHAGYQITLITGTPDSAPLSILHWVTGVFSLIRLQEQYYGKGKVAVIFKHSW